MVMLGPTIVQVHQSYLSRPFSTFNGFFKCLALTYLVPKEHRTAAEILGH